MGRWKIGGYFQNACLISSQSRYDRFDTSAYLILSHRPAQRLEKCEISMQDNDERLGTRHPIKTAVMGFPADKVTCRMQTFESISLRPLRYVCLFSFYRTASHSVWKNARFRCKITMKVGYATPDKARRYGISCGQGDLPDANFRVLPLAIACVHLLIQLPAVQGKSRIQYYTSCSGDCQFFGGGKLENLAGAVWMAVLLGAAGAFA